MLISKGGRTKEFTPKNPVVVIIIVKIPSGIPNVHPKITFFWSHVYVASKLY